MDPTPIAMCKFHVSPTTLHGLGGSGNPAPSFKHAFMCIGDINELWRMWQELLSALWILTQNGTWGLYRVSDKDIKFIIIPLRVKIHNAPGNSLKPKHWDE